MLRGTGNLTTERAAYLEEMRKQLQLPEDKAQKIIREVRPAAAPLAVLLGWALCRGPPGRMHPRRPPTYRPPPAQLRTEMVGVTAALEEAGGEKWTIDRVLDSHKKGIDVKKVRV